MKRNLFFMLKNPFKSEKSEMSNKFALMAIQASSETFSSRFHLSFTLVVSVYRLWKNLSLSFITLLTYPAAPPEWCHRNACDVNDIRRYYGIPGWRLKMCGNCVKLEMHERQAVVSFWHNLWIFSFPWNHLERSLNSVEEGKANMWSQTEKIRRKILNFKWDVR